MLLCVDVLKSKWAVIRWQFSFCLSRVDGRSMNRIIIYMRRTTSVLCVVPRTLTFARTSFHENTESMQALLLHFICLLT